MGRITPIRAGSGLFIFLALLSGCHPTTGNPDVLKEYAGMYVPYQSECKSAFYFQAHSPKTTSIAAQVVTELVSVNKGWVAHPDFMSTIYLRDDFDGRYLRHRKATGFLGLKLNEEDIKIDFSKYPNITVRDRKRHTMCKYSLSEKPWYTRQSSRDEKTIDEIRKKLISSWH